MGSAGSVLIIGKSSARRHSEAEDCASPTPDGPQRGPQRSHESSTGHRSSLLMSSTSVLTRAFMPRQRALQGECESRDYGVDGTRYTQPFGLGVPMPTSLTQFVVVGKLGRGGFAQVLKARYDHTEGLTLEGQEERMYAIKVQQLAKAGGKAMSASSNGRANRRLLDEHRILSELTHPFVVNYLCTLYDSSCSYMVLEYLPGGNLYNFQASRPRRQFKEDEARFLSMELILGLEYMHSRRVTYRDLKPENILVDARGHIRLTDFGLAKLLTENKHHSVIGTPDYMAPELISRIPYGHEVDLWAFGCILFELLHSHAPFVSATQNEMFSRILKGRPHKTRKGSPEVVGLISSLLCVDVRQRATHPDIRVHPFFAGHDWGRVLKKGVPSPFKVAVKKDKHKIGANLADYVSAGSKHSHRAGMGANPEDAIWVAKTAVGIRKYHAFSPEWETDGDVSTRGIVDTIEGDASAQGVVRMVAIEQKWTVIVKLNYLWSKLCDQPSDWELVADPSFTVTSPLAKCLKNVSRVLVGKEVVTNDRDNTLSGTESLSKMLPRSGRCFPGTSISAEVRLSVCKRDVLFDDHRVAYYGSVSALSCQASVPFACFVTFTPDGRASTLEHVLDEASLRMQFLHAIFSALQGPSSASGTVGSPGRIRGRKSRPPTTEITLNQVHGFEFIDVLKSGAMSEVWRARRGDMQHGDDVVVKIRNMAQGSNYEMSRQVDIHSMLNHPFVAEYITSFTWNNHHFMVLEHHAHGDLTMLREKLRLQHEDPIPDRLFFSIKSLRIIAAELAMALSFLHAQGVVHLDLRPEHVLISADSHVRLGGFTQARDMFMPPFNCTYAHPGYQPPERRVRGGMMASVGAQDDWWAFGCLMYHILTDRPVPDSADGKSGESYPVPLDDVVVAFYTEAGERDSLESLHSMIKGLLVINLTSRLFGESVLGHDFIQGVDQKLLLLRSGHTFPGAASPAVPSSNSKMMVSLESAMAAERDLPASTGLPCIDSRGAAESEAAQAADLDTPISQPDDAPSPVAPNDEPPVRTPAASTSANAPTEGSPRSKEEEATPPEGSGSDPTAAARTETCRRFVELATELCTEREEWRKIVHNEDWFMTSRPSFLLGMDTNFKLQLGDMAMPSCIRNSVGLTDLLQQLDALKRKPRMPRRRLAFKSLIWNSERTLARVQVRFFTQAAEVRGGAVGSGEAKGGEGQAGDEGVDVVTEQVMIFVFDSGAKLCKVDTVMDTSHLPWASEALQQATAPFAAAAAAAAAGNAGDDAGRGRRPQRSS